MVASDGDGIGYVMPMAAGTLSQRLAKVRHSALGSMPALALCCTGRCCVYCQLGAAYAPCLCMRFHKEEADYMCKAVTAPGC